MTDKETGDSMEERLASMTTQQLAELARRCDILHGDKDTKGYVAMLISWLALRETPSRFTSNELSAAASLEGAVPVDLKRAAAAAHEEKIARFHAMVSDCDHWFLAYSFFSGGAEYAFLWETPYDEIHRKYAGVKAWYDAIGTGTCFTVEHVEADPACHRSTAPGVPMTNGVFFIGEK